MDAALRGARNAGGLTVGVTGGHDAGEVSPACDVAIVSGLHEARNNVIVLSAAALVVCGMSAGTASEVALAVRASRPVVLLGADDVTREFFLRLGGAHVRTASTPHEVVELLRGLTRSQG